MHQLVSLSLRGTSELEKMAKLVVKEEQAVAREFEEAATTRDNQKKSKKKIFGFCSQHFYSKSL